jgi:hypothetical protein
MTMKLSLTRRRLLQAAAMLPSAAIVGCASLQSEDNPSVQAEDPVARALAYYPNSNDVPADHPLATTHKPEQTCATCVHLRGDSGDSLRRCPTFPGRRVNAQGWCTLWAKS